ncbi:MAG: hypothetical protein GY866_33400 [Proteobacteria bacterium]|nr:hypothetical protein [Pseudomonadota bacterium]
MKKLLVSMLIVLLIAFIGCKTTEEEPEENVFTNNKSSAASTYSLAVGDANCPNGGVAIETGIDENGNGVLDDDEVDETQYVCNGVSGQNGADGQDGADGQGDSGTNSLVSISDEPAGVNCTVGGKIIETGLDNGDGGGTAGDNTLQPGEIDSAEYVCNGASGDDGLKSLVKVTNETAGTNCTNGGLKVSNVRLESCRA